MEEGEIWKVTRPSPRDAHVILDIVPRLSQPHLQLLT